MPGNRCAAWPRPSTARLAAAAKWCGCARWRNCCRRRSRAASASPRKRWKSRLPGARLIAARLRRCRRLAPEGRPAQRKRTGRRTGTWVTANTSNAKRPPGWRVATRPTGRPRPARSPHGAMQRPRIASPPAPGRGVEPGRPAKAVGAGVAAGAMPARGDWNWSRRGLHDLDAASALNPAGLAFARRPAATRGGGWRFAFAGCVAACAIGGFALLHSAPVEQRTYRSAAGTSRTSRSRTVRATLSGDSLVSVAPVPARTRHRPATRRGVLRRGQGREPAIRGARRRPRSDRRRHPFRGAPRQRRAARGRDRRSGAADSPDPARRTGNPPPSCRPAAWPKSTPTAPRCASAPRPRPSALSWRSGVLASRHVAHRGRG